MKVRPSKKLLFCVFLIITLYLTLYYFTLLNFPYICGISDPWVLIWCGSPPGFLFPWPFPPGPLEALTPNNNLIDYIIYVYFFNSGLFLVLLGLLWILDAILFYLWIYRKD
jgi:hypothetical protein